MKKKSKKKIIGIILFVLILIFIAGILIVRSFFVQKHIEPSELSNDAIVETPKGDIRGSLDDGVYQYLGVPYAEAKERFVPAEEVEAWDGILDAVEVGPISPQSSMLSLSSGSREGTDNNCQNLNIWTPGIHDGKRRAVMVWLHGGGFSSGSANEADYNGTDLSRSGDVVVVSVNHRLGVSGFLNLSAYGEKYRYSANVGLTDIVCALQWIQDNIEYFGGDPDNVTLFGQSGGGAKVLAMMSSPYAKGLFGKGIVQSGATETVGVSFTSQEASSRLTDRILEQLGITAENIEDLQKVDMKKLQEVSQKALQETAEEFKIPGPFSGYQMEWEPVVDGDYIPENPVTENSFAESGKDVELLIGSNLNEWTTLMGGDQGELTQEEQEAYEQAYPDKDPSKANKVDTLIRLPMLKIMSHKVKQGGAPVYAYVFTWDKGSHGASHGAEIPFVFNHPQESKAAERVAAQISQAWVNFAKNGIPSADGMPQWEAYNLEQKATMILDENPKLVYGHDEKLMNLLAPDYQY